MDSSWINGKPAGELEVEDRGLAYGHGVFETLRIDQHRAPLLEYHMQRLQRGCDALSVACDSNAIARQLEQFVADKPPAGVAKVTVTGGIGGRGYQAPEQPQSNVILQWHELPALDKTGLTVRICQHRLAINPPLAGLKHLNRLDQVLARAEWSDPDIDEGIVLDSDDRVVEAVSSNLFVFFAEGQGGWVTPPLHRCGVAGVMRRVIMEQLCPAQQVTVVERDITLDELAAAQEVVVCNSVAGIRPVASIIDLAKYRIGEYGAALRQALRELYPCY